MAGLDPPFPQNSRDKGHLSEPRAGSDHTFDGSAGPRLLVSVGDQSVARDQVSTSNCSLTKGILLPRSLMLHLRNFRLFNLDASLLCDGVVLVYLRSLLRTFEAGKKVLFDTNIRAVVHERVPNGQDHKRAQLGIVRG